MTSEIRKNVPAPTVRGSVTNPSSARARGASTGSQGSRPTALHVVGLLEKGAARSTIPQCSSVPRGSSRVIDRSHLPGLEPDCFVAHRDSPFAVHETSVGRIGMAIWCDIRHSVQLALGGAGGVALGDPGHPTRARAIEKRAFLVGADLAGKERRQQVPRARQRRCDRGWQRGSATLRRRRAGIGPAAGLRLRSWRL